MAVQGRMIWLDCLRLVAGVSMLILHTTSDPRGQPWVNYAEAERIAPLLLRAVVYMARTELFLIISIFLLLLALERRPRGYAQTIGEQTQRLVVPFLFWTVFYAGYGLIKANAFGYLPSALAELGDPTEWIGFILLGSVKYHMHFLPTLFGLVLMYPLFRLSVKYPGLGVAVLVCLAIKWELDGFLYGTLWGYEIQPFLVRAVKILTYAGYGMVAGAALGILKNTSETTRQAWFAPIVFFGLLLFLIKLVATWKTVEGGQWPFTYMPGYWADFLFPAVLFSACLALGHLNWPLLISKLAPFSFGIYLCHPIFLDLCEIALRDVTWAPLAQIATKIGITLFATSVLVFGISKTPALAWTVGLGPTPFKLTTLWERKQSHAD